MLDAEAWMGRTLTEALTLVGAPDVPRPEQGMAARVASSLLDHLSWNERRAADVMVALRRCVEGSHDNFGAVDALIDLVRRKEGRHPAKVVSALARIAERAFERRFLMTLHAVTVVMLDDDVWSGAVEHDWVEACVRWGLARAVKVRDPAGELLHLYLPRFGTDHAWLRGVIREYPEVVRSGWLDCSTRVALHASAPVAENWSRLTELVEDETLSSLNIDLFKARIDEAVESLQEAVARASSEDCEAAKAVVLAGWLSRLLASE